MTKEALLALEAEVARFRTWADTYLVTERSGEWELDYEDWPRLYTAFAAFIASTPCRLWSDATVRMVLYALARDNEIGYLTQEVRKDLQEFLCLAEQAVVSPEKYAKSQIVTELGRIIPSTPQIETLLWQFAHDEDEYVRRLAMSALADIGSPRVAELIEPAWDMEHEQQRMAVLYVLWKTHSSLLERYLRRAEADGRPYLVEYAARVREGNPL